MSTYIITIFTLKLLRYTEVFGVAVFGYSSISDEKFQHVASVLAGSCSLSRQIAFTGD